MDDLDKLSKRVTNPTFVKAHRQNKIKAVADAIGRELTSAEQAGVRALTHSQLKQVVTTLRPRKGGAHPPE
jgi:hypothetical protein